jgi:serine protease Do
VIGRLLLVALALLFLPGADPEPRENPLWTTLEPVPAEEVSGGSCSVFAAVVERARPAVVAIHTMGQAGTAGTGFPFNPWRLFPEVPRREREEGIGSGFVIRKDGYIVTNHHVVVGADSLVIRVEGLSAAMNARVVGSDPRSDLALLKVDAPRPLPVLPLGNSDRLPVGAWVVAIGNPFGLTAVATKGIVSGKGRTLGDLPAFKIGYFDFIQTDAAIDLGNSGGPLLNLRGEVIGINTAINSRARGIGFAVPVDLAKAVLPHLLRDGRVLRSYLGISVDKVTWELAESFGMERPRGVLVTKVLEGKPARKAGMKPGDILLEYNGMVIRGTMDVGWRVATAPADKPVKAVIWRDGARKTFEVIPSVRQSDQMEAREPPPSAESESSHRLGLLVVNLDEKTAGGVGLEPGTRGVVVVGVQDDAALHEIRVGDVITSINDEEVSSPEQFEEVVSRIKRGQMIRFYILRQRGALYVALPKRWD